MNDYWKNVLQTSQETNDVEAITSMLSSIVPIEKSFNLNDHNQRQHIVSDFMSNRCVDNIFNAILYTIFFSDLHTDKLSTGIYSQFFQHFVLIPCQDYVKTKNQKVEHLFTEKTIYLNNLMDTVIMLSALFPLRKAELRLSDLIIDDDDDIHSLKDPTALDPSLLTDNKFFKALVSSLILFVHPSVEAIESLDVYDDSEPYKMIVEFGLIGALLVCTRKRHSFAQKQTSSEMVDDTDKPQCYQLTMEKLNTMCTRNSSDLFCKLYFAYLNYLPRQKILSNNNDPSANLKLSTSQNDDVKAIQKIIHLFLSQSHDEQIYFSFYERYIAGQGTVEDTKMICIILRFTCVWLDRASILKIYPSLICK